MGNFITKGIYSSGMVLQRECVNCIFGECKADAEVTLTFRSQTYKCKADKNGQWKIEYESGLAGGPFEMNLNCEDEKIQFTDVYVGEVWVSSGQSNSQLTMTRLKYSYPEEFKLPENPNIRIITVPVRYSFDGVKDFVENPQWKPVNAENLESMSGTSYFFAKKLQQELKIPVGIISTCQGGTPIGAWINKESVLESGVKRLIDEQKFYSVPENLEKEQKRKTEESEEWENKIIQTDLGSVEHWENLSFQDIQTSWQDVTVPGELNLLNSAGILWLKKEIELTELQVLHFNNMKTNLWFGTIIDADEIFVNGVKVGSTGYCYPPRRYVVPAGTLKPGKNTISIRVQQNYRNIPIRFFSEKPYFLFTDNVKVHPVAYRNTEIPVLMPVPENGELIDLSGQWKSKIGTCVYDAPQADFFEYKASAMYNSMIGPCSNYAVKGVLWYQGESDEKNHKDYKNLLITLINSWRKEFKYASENMPFVVVQLPNWTDGRNEDVCSVSNDWAFIRQAQSDAVDSVENAALTINIDTGEWNDLHPEKKLTTGFRAAREALRIAYGEELNTYPRAIECDKGEDSFDVIFECGNTELQAFEVIENSCRQENISETKEIFGFSFLVKDGNKELVVNANAFLKDKNRVCVSFPKDYSVEKGKNKIQELRYLWAGSPNPINLYSKEKLPAAPFRIIF